MSDFFSSFSITYIIYNNVNVGAVEHSRSKEMTILAPVSAAQHLGDGETESLYC